MSRRVSGSKVLRSSVFVYMGETNLWVMLQAYQSARLTTSYVMRSYGNHHHLNPGNQSQSYSPLASKQYLSYASRPVLVRNPKNEEEWWLQAHASTCLPVSVCLCCLTHHGAQCPTVSVCMIRLPDPTALPSTSRLSNDQFHNVLHVDRSSTSIIRLSYLPVFVIILK